MLQEHDLHPNELSHNINEALSHSAHVVLAQAYLDQGFTVNHLGLSFITENDLYPHQARVRTRGRREQRTDLESMTRDLSELRIGDPVVHQEHGVGRYPSLLSTSLR